MAGSDPDDRKIELEIAELELRVAELRRRASPRTRALRWIVNAGTAIGAVIAVASILLAVASYRAEAEREEARRFAGLLKVLQSPGGGREFPDEDEAISTFGELKARYLGETYAFRVAMGVMVYAGQPHENLTWVREAATDALIGAVDALEDHRELAIVQGKWFELREEAARIAGGQLAERVATAHQRIDAAMARSQRRLGR